MTVRQIEEEMPATELSEWFGVYYIEAKEAEKARKQRRH